MAYRTTPMTTPHVTHIPGGLDIGSQVIVRGRVSDGEERFHINLQNHEDEDSADIAFHFNPRNEEQTVVRNSFQSGWQEEERDIPHFPFSNGSEFTIRIVVSGEAYVVIVNNEKFIEYNHRLNYQDVKYMWLSAGAEYHEAKIQHQCRVPFGGEFTDGMKSGKAVRVRGVVNDDADSFAINFNNDPDGRMIGVHFNPRQGEEDVVLNSDMGGWGEEERGQPWFPFGRGQFFYVLFIAHQENLNIYVNDKYFTSYKFRFHPENIKFLEIKGDVILMDVEFIDPLSDDYVKKVAFGLEKYDQISVKGFFYPEGTRFSVNLLHGTSPDDDVALHFNPRRDYGEVVLNSRLGGDWEEEEKHSLPHSMVDMVPFNVTILNKEDKFKIYVNGNKLSSFKTRSDPKEIRGIHASGDAYIYDVKLIQKVYSPFVDKVPRPLEPGSWITVIGTPTDGSDGFAINLQAGDSVEYANNVALHFNPRLHDQVTVLNDLQDGNFGNEERIQDSFPFEEKKKFEVNILVMVDAYRIFVNGQRYADFMHRMEPRAASHLFVYADCDLFEPEWF